MNPDSTELKRAGERARKAREKRAAARQLVEKAGDDPQRQAMANLALEMAQNEVEETESLQAMLLRQAAGFSSSAGGARFLDDPDKVALLQELGNRADSSGGPVIGTHPLGYMCSREEFMAMLPPNGSRMAVANSEPDIPDTARVGPYQGIVPQPYRPLELLDLIPTQEWDGGKSFDFTREGGTMDQDAAETAEGALKPGADLQLADGQCVVATIPAWLKLKRQQLSDVPALGTRSQNRLLYKIRRRLENQIVLGNGVGENMLGILNTTGIAAVPYPPAAGGTPAESALTGIADVLASSLQPNAVVINPFDWVMMQVIKSVGSGDYLSGNGPFGVQPNTLWGVPVIRTTLMPRGQCLVGDFTNSLTLFVREAPNLRISDADQDDFLRNQLTYLAETRAGIAIWQPSGFAVVHLAAVNTIAVALAPNSAAHGGNTVAVTVTVTDSNGDPLVAEQVAVVASGGCTVSPSPAVDNGDGTYSTELTTGSSPGAVTVTASDGSVSGSAALTVT